MSHTSMEIVRRPRATITSLQKQKLSEIKVIHER